MVSGEVLSILKEVFLTLTLGQRQLMTPQCKVPNPETKFGAEHQKVPGEEAAVNTSGAMKKQYRKRNITAERSGQPEKRTRGNCGACKELVIADSKMTLREGVAQREGNFVRKYWTRNNVEPETQKGRAFGKGRWAWNSTMV
jgi:hypothetical protein